MQFIYAGSTLGGIDMVTTQCGLAEPVGSNGAGLKTVLAISRCIFRSFGGWDSRKKITTIAITRLSCVDELSDAEKHGAHCTDW